MSKKKKKRMTKGNISDYNEFLAIKKELKKNITKQEKSFINNVLNTKSIYKTTKNIFFTEKNKKNRAFNNSTILLLNDLLVQFLEPYAKNEKQKQILIPAISLGISYFAVSKLSSKRNSSSGENKNH